MVDLSIIIINYNTFELTSNCISSIYSFTKGISFEIILVDNKSTECNPDLFKDKFPMITVLKNDVNIGFAGGNNVGIRNSTGELILLLNSDTELVDNSIRLAHQTLEWGKSRNIGVVSGKLLYPDGKLQYQCGRFPSIKLQLLELFRLQKLIPKRLREELLLGGFFDHSRAVFPDWIWGTFFMFSRDVLKVFPECELTETYFMYQEDLEWCFYIRKSGFKIYYDPAINIIHHFSSSSRTEDLVRRKQQYLKTNYSDFLRRHYGTIYARIFLYLQELNKKIQFT